MNKWLGFSFPVCKFNHNNVIKEDATEIENEDTTEIIVGFPFFSRPADCRVNRIYNWSNQVHGWIGGHPLLPYVNTFYFLWYRFQREGGGGGIVAFSSLMDVRYKIEWQEHHLICIHSRIAMDVRYILEWWTIAIYNATTRLVYHSENSIAFTLFMQWEKKKGYMKSPPYIFPKCTDALDLKKTGI